MDNQHQKIKGYRDLSQEEIDLMNQVKEKGAELSALVDELDKLTELQVAQGNLNAIESEARRWVSIGKTHLQIGLMALTRSVAQPGFF